MKTKKQKKETSLRKPAKKMMSYLGVVAMLCTSFPVASEAQNVCEIPSDACIEHTSKKDEINVQTTIENAGSTEYYDQDDSCQYGCSGSCWSSCQSSCRGYCSSGCTGSCSSGCKATCSNGCNGGSGYRW